MAAENNWTLGEYVDGLNQQLSHLYSFAKQMNELDFAISLSGEFRGAQDAGWSTTITAHEVAKELNEYSTKPGSRSKAEFRTILMLYCQLSEAGGVYEAIKNTMGVITLKPYNLWPFQDLVQVRGVGRRIIGPNANATFRNLATQAMTIGMPILSRLLEDTFRDDLRNAISHADYVIWDDGVRLRNRNGGYAKKLSFDDVNTAISRGMAFFQILNDHSGAVIRSYDPPKTVVGRFSQNFPMPWILHYDPTIGSFGLSGSSPGAVTTPEYERQVILNGLLGGRVLALFMTDRRHLENTLEHHIATAGFEPNIVVMGKELFDRLLHDIERENLWDPRQVTSPPGTLLLASPWGFRFLRDSGDFDLLLSKSELIYEVGVDEPSA